MKDRTDHEFLTIVHRLQPVTVQALCAASGVTATAIRQRLLRLQADGVLARDVARGVRGRPHYTYSVTESGLKSLGDDHAEMAAILWREIMRIESGDVREKVLAGVKQALVQRFDVQPFIPQAGSEALTNRLSQVCNRLVEHGFDVDFSAESAVSLPILREHNCPYHEIADEDPGFCEFEQSVFAELIGAPVELSACRHDGSSHCEFQVGRKTVKQRTEEPAAEPVQI
ncbi:helix-turn-helix transcriptional regulator [Planctomicrobium piriforme]|uniref:Predicted transcriptional regulator, ArsR family n=1 Tax=Planctomicrobium piriforme TaxID=1576369 RepID=A0A1I3D4Z7_9PLAN|nr:hypothetical protein [Planctomicrobium piriforme]SFH81757.1 Predicted transcriptional regulator, ArsR family [Planctomicrobium piriforme]